MSALKLLVAVDLAKSDQEVFSLINSLGAQSEAVVVLLHVVGPDLALSDPRVRDTVCSEARRELLRLERQYLSPHFDSRVSVRIGSRWQEILAEARQTEADWIILSRDSVRRGRSLLARFPGASKKPVGL